MSEKIIRDPVHDVIAFRIDLPTDALLFRLLSADEVQRLRRIRQLGMASLAYPAADHSRYSHSLGVMETARKILTRLRRTFYMEEDKVCTCLAAALLHDLGHGPFSHVFERVSGVPHERATERLILDGESTINRILSDYDAALPRRVADLLISTGPSTPRSLWRDIISSQLDADRLDYLLRDNLMTGSQYGNYDLEWLVHALTIDESSNRLAVHFKGVSAVEAYLQSRYHMYRNVYFHKVVRSAEGMVKLALQRARALAEQGRLPWPGGQEPVHRALLGHTLPVAQFIELDDISVQACFKAWCASEDPMLAGLCRGLLMREVYKTIDVSSLDAAAAGRALGAIGEAIVQAGGEREYDVFYDEPSETPYERYQPADAPAAAGEILVIDRDGRLKEFATISPLSQALNRQLMFRRIHVAARWRDLAERVVSGLR